MTQQDLTDLRAAAAARHAAEDARDARLEQLIGAAACLIAAAMFTAAAFAMAAL